MCRQYQLAYDDATPEPGVERLLLESLNVSIMGRVLHVTPPTRQPNIKITLQLSAEAD